MRERLFRKIKQNNAFTLMETLIVVAIMVILMGISMVGFYDYSVTMKMTELDNYAKTIYLEAQNQLIAEKVEGGMPKLAAKFEANCEDYRLTVVPQDYSYASDDTEWKNLYQISKDNIEYSDCLISTESYIYNESGDYIIEFNPQTGMVYGVFYWEKDTDIDYENDVVKLVDRTREERTAARIGYYGGMTTETTDNIVVLGQRVDLINEEELYLKISYDGSSRLKAHYQDALMIEYSVTDQHGNVWSRVIDSNNIFEQTDNVDVDVTDRRLEIYVLLDSMNYSFADLVSQKDSDDVGDLVLDDELTFVVSSTYDHGSDYCWESNDSSPVLGNGLFADGTDKIEKVETVDGEDVIILDENGLPVFTGINVQIEKIRHLRNLDFLSAESEVNIEITDHVDFDSNNYSWEIKPSTNGNNLISYVDENAAERALDAFAPISNPAVFENDSCVVSIDGNGNSIRNFIINGETDNVGLFSKLNNVSVSNIIIEDITINANGFDNVGTLAGSITGGVVSNCGARLSTGKTEGIVVTTYSQTPCTHIVIDDEGNENEVACEYANVMECRYNTYVVSGEDNVGGLVGVLDGAQVNSCYAAIKVNATGNNVGGFVGIAQDTNRANSGIDIFSCYSSGDVTGNNNVGGFVGCAKNIMIGDVYGEEKRGVYSTSDVYANDIVGGFVGLSNGTTYTSCTAYGSVNTQSGAGAIDKTVEPENSSAITAGGFVAANTEASSTYNDCSYLLQTDYNTKVAANKIASKSYNEYKPVDEADDIALSVPYDASLFQLGFPFMKGWETQNEMGHYGDWPSQYVINSSLVYYEKYDDGDGTYSFGYYCITSIKGSDEEWLLNTLQDRECIEDGYAILTRYNLESVNYKLQVGSGEVIEGKDAVELEGELSTVDGAEEKLVLLTRQKNVTFKICDSNGNVEESADSFNVSGMYLYQLPYELQCTDRYNVTNFYDRLILTDGVIYNANVNAPKTTVIDGLVFFYCPHFAKTAVNPNLSDDPSELLEETLDNPDKVIVRSARQLNALGRFQYYWNDKGGNPGKLKFAQEVDVNFGTYAGIEKEYCGRVFNLLAFGQDYSNKPIGDPSNMTVTGADGFVYGQFENDYDGRGNKIIDYCVQSDNQYVGLFGEVYKASINNIVMVVSEETAEKLKSGDVSGTYLDTSLDSDNPEDVKRYNNAGRVICTFQDATTNTGNNRKRVGVGALVGLNYTVGSTGFEIGPNFNFSNTSGARSGEYTIENCATAGYTVEYQINGLASRKQQPVGVAVGGLIGYNFGDIKSCSAANTVRLDANVASATDTAVFLGGFAGSEYYGTTVHCYSGGNIVVDKCSINRLRIGGFCPGWLETREYQGETLNDDEVVRYEHIYSYTTVDDGIWGVTESANSNKYKYLFPCTSRLKESYSNNRWNTDAIEGTEVRVPGMAYYLDTFFDEHMDEINSNGVSSAMLSENGAVTQYYMHYERGWFTEWGQTCEPTSYNNLSDIEAHRKNLAVSEDVQTGSFLGIPLYSTYTEPYDGHVAQESYSISGYLKNMAYQFPAVTYKIQYDKEGNETGRTYVHYGDWPVESEKVTQNYPTYYEKYDDESIGYYIVRPNGSGEYYVRNKAGEVKKVESLPGDEKAIVASGYGILTMNDVEGKVFTTTIQNYLADGTIGGLYTYEFEEYELNTTANNRCITIEDFEYNEVSMEEGKIITNIIEVVKDVYVNPNFAAAISLNETDLGTADKPLQVRTQSQLLSVNNINVPEVYMEMTHSIDLDDTYQSINVKATQIFDGGMVHGFTIRGAKVTVFASNSGTIQNAVVLNSNIVTEDNTAIFVNSNTGIIKNSKVVDSKIESTGVVAGFVYSNTGYIEGSGVHAENSYDSVTVEGARAYGFAAENKYVVKDQKIVEETGVIQHCYAVGTVIGSSEAAGFTRNNEGIIKLSYANANVTATSTSARAAGFAISGGNTYDAKEVVGENNVVDVSVTPELTECYSAGRVAGYEAAGFMMEGTVSKCYVIAEIDGTNQYGFAGEEATITECYVGYDEKTEYNTEFKDDENAITLRELMSDPQYVDYESTEALAEPYSPILGKYYPYPVVGIAHYGDWKAPTVENINTNITDRLINELNENSYVGIFYYERYMDGSYGFSMKCLTSWYDEARDIYYLATGEEPVVSSGYAVFYKNANWNVINGFNSNDITDYDVNVLEDFSIPGLDPSYKFGYITNDGLQDAFTRTLQMGNTVRIITIWDGRDVEDRK